MPYRNMTPEIKYKHLESERNSAIDSVKSAASDLEYLNKESLKGFDNYYDKILFYSAGAFSFTLALVNIVAQQDKVGALTKSSFIIPNEVALTETKESIAMGKNFESNRGKLPWPVAKGTVTEG